ncbi:YceI family protein, partial [bacterium]|nr:YceI family protein [bacterium]
MFEMLPNDKQNSVRFVSDAPTEKIVGKTNQISATLELDPDNVAATAVGVFEVDLTTLKTGIGLRDRHMRENHLETDEFPVAIFRLIRVISTDKPALIPGEQVQVDAEGELILHGVAKTYRIPVTV